MTSDLLIPDRMAHLPLDRHGRPVPWFVAWIDGQPDHRVVAPGRVDDALRFGCCWLCGDTLGAHKAFVIGPMCAVNRISAEPPSHRDCAVYGARACPFLSTPQMVRRDKGKPAEIVDPGGTMLRRNPGVALVWITRSFDPLHLPNGLIFQIGDPTETRWYAQGRAATRAEVVASMESGLPLLRGEAETEGPAALAELERQYAVALELVPS